MLRLNPGDNQGIRTNLATTLLHEGRWTVALDFAQKWLKKSTGDGAPMSRGGTLFGEPRREPHPPNVEKKLEKCWGSEFIHTAAYASFKLLGDCELSRQYLRIAAKVNPFILLRVLGKITKPSTYLCFSQEFCDGLNIDTLLAEPNMYPRSPNSPEEAHDYLWIAQDLWMKEDVWEWANNNPDAKSIILKNCSNEVQGCRVREGDVAQFKRCAACRLVSDMSTSFTFTSRRQCLMKHSQRRYPTAVFHAKKPTGLSTRKASSHPKFSCSRAILIQTISVQGASGNQGSNEGFCSRYSTIANKGGSIMKRLVGQYVGL